MADTPSPAAARLRQPRWLDPRLVAGMLLILLSVVVGARVLASADTYDLVWAVTRDLPRGTELVDGDLRRQRVRLPGGIDRYARTSPVGKVLTRDVGAGELLPEAALVPKDQAAPTRLVTVPVERSHALGGELRRGDVVDIVATFRQSGGRGSVTSPVLKGVTVVDVVEESGTFGGGGRDFAIVVAVPPERALELAAAIRSGELDVIKVVRAGDIGDRSVTTAPSAAPR